MASARPRGNLQNEIKSFIFKILLNDRDFIRHHRESDIFVISLSNSSPIGQTKTDAVPAQAGLATNAGLPGCEIGQRGSG